MAGRTVQTGLYVRGVHKAHVIGDPVHPCPVDRRVRFPVGLKELDLRAISGDNSMTEHALLNGWDGGGGFSPHATVTKLAWDGGVSGVNRVVKRYWLLGGASYGSTGRHQKEQDREDAGTAE